MQQSITTTLAVALVFALTGCQTRQADPTIAGDWSEPVNGVRMMAVPIEDSPYVMGSRTVLIFTQNVGDDGVQLPAISPAPFVTVRPDGRHLHEKPRLSGNLRIQIESAQNEGIHDPGLLPGMLDETQSMSPDLMPGEIRVFALILKTDDAPLEAMQQLRDHTIQTGMTQWLIHRPEPHRYRVYLSYRPDGFGPLAINQMRKIPDFQWSGKQIDLPPFEITITSTDNNSQ